MFAVPLVKECHFDVQLWKFGVVVFLQFQVSQQGMHASLRVL